MRATKTQNAETTERGDDVASEKSGRGRALWTARLVAVTAVALAAALISGAPAHAGYGEETDANGCPKINFTPNVDYQALPFPLPIKVQPSVVGSLRAGNRVVGCPAVADPVQLGYRFFWFVVNEDGTKKRVASRPELTIRPEWSGKRLQSRTIMTIPGRPLQTVWSKAWRVR
jgi:hypothetical protein